MVIINCFGKANTSNNARGGKSKVGIVLITTLEPKGGKSTVGIVLIPTIEPRAGLLPCMGSRLSLLILTKMIEDACAIIVQAATCIVVKILHEEEFYASSCAGRIKAVFSNQFTMFIDVLAPPIFNVLIACCTNHSKGFIQNLLQK